MGPDFGTEEDRPGGADKLGALDGADSRLFGVDDLDVDLEVGKEGLAVGVEDRGMDLVGVEDLTLVALGLMEAKVACEVGVEDLEGFNVKGNVGRPVGVAALEVPGEIPPDNEGLLFPLLEDFCPVDKVGCAVAMLLEAGSAWPLACYNP